MHTLCVRLLSTAALLAAQASLAFTPPTTPAQASLAQVPVEFEANQGQHDSAIRYLARAQGYRMFLMDAGAVISLSRPESEKHAGPSVVQMRFARANQEPELVGQQPSEHKTSYLRGDDMSVSHADISNYARVLYRNIYPGIDVAFYGKNGAVEYDLLLQPGANPKRVEIAFDGARRLDLDERGDLLIHTASGVLTQHRPVVYQERNGVRQMVEAAYKVMPGHKVQLQLARYDRKRQLTIDPVLSYSTYIGGSGFETLNAIAVDASGSAYVTGTTDSADWPLVGAYQSKILGTKDVVVAKLNPQGTGLLYSTYIGKRGVISEGSAIAVDASGNAYIAGTTGSGYPTTSGVYAETGSGLFVTKLNAAGNALGYSTYLQSAGAKPSAIRLDASGNVVVVGQTTDTIPATGTAFQAFNPSVGIGSGFVIKLNPTGSSLVFATYLGGSAEDNARGVALDPAGNIYVTGHTKSDNFPVTSGAYQRIRKGGSDAFVTKIKPDGSGLLYSTYLGGTVDDRAAAIAVDATGRAYLTGTTFSTDFPLVEGLPKPLNHNGYNVAFITALSADGASVRMSSYFGGVPCYGSCLLTSDTDAGTGIAVDASGQHIYVVGYLRSPYVTALKNAIQVKDGTRDLTDAMVLKIESDPLTGRIFNLRYATRLGGSVFEYAAGVAIDPLGNAYVVGNTDQGYGFPVTPGAFAVTAKSTAADGFVAKISTLGRPVTVEGNCGSANTPTQLKATTAINATGDMVFKSGDATVATVPITGGIAAWSGLLPVGAHKLTAMRASDGVASAPMFCPVNQ